MNNKVIIMWGFIVFALVIAVYIIGINESKDSEYKEFKDQVRLSVDDYMNGNDKWPGDEGVLIVDLEDLYKNRHISSLEFNELLCSGSVTVQKSHNNYHYDYDIDCVKEIKE